MNDYSDASVITYRDELIVELLGTDDYGSLDVVSYQFDYDDESRKVVVPKQTIDGGHRSAVEAVLQEQGYRLETADP